MFRAPHIMEVHPSFPAETVAEFIAYAKAHPGRINMASAGTWTISHMAGELFAMMTGIALTHVPYRGAAPALSDLLGRQVQVMFDNAASSTGHIRAGRLRALAVTTATRMEVLPDVPTIGEFVRGYEASNVNGVGVPVKTPADMVAKLNSEICAVLNDRVIGARFAELGGAAMIGSSAKYRAFLVEETDKWAGVVKTAPSEPTESGFCQRIKLKSYPLVESGGILWAYMGPPEAEPELPVFEWTEVPATRRYFSKRWQECNNRKSTRLNS